MNLRGTPSILWAGSKWRPIQIAACRTRSSAARNSWTDKRSTK